MLSVALFYLVAVICSARRTHALPLYPDTNLEPQAEFIQKLVSEVEDGPNTAEGEQRDVNNLYPLLLQHNGGRDSWNKGTKDSTQQDRFANMVDDLKEAVLKLAALQTTPAAPHTSSLMRPQALSLHITIPDLMQYLS
uniref:Urotensin-related peptide 1 n=1 Tax=Lates calcarifer TaxID=8187 RepID=A0A4W6FT72_LATCA